MEDHTLAAQQYFPTYRFDPAHKEVALEEYKSAVRTLESEERIFAAATAVAVFLAGLLSWITAAGLETAIKFLEADLGKAPVIALIGASVLVFTRLGVEYFGERQRSIVNAARKVIILRRILGVSYGNVELVLPRDRVEGANEPYVIPMFSGWLAPTCLPVYLIAFLSSVVLLIIVAKYRSVTVDLGPIAGWLSSISVSVDPKYSALVPYGVASFWLIYLLASYRQKLFDSHESTLLGLACAVARVLNIRLVDRFEYVIYRARLSVFEAERLKIPLEKQIPILVHMEDRTFWKHPGISLRGILRAIWARVSRGKRSGGSTITQQLVRTLFIPSNQPAVRRKVVEIGLALWFEKFFTKDEIAKLYLGSVRFEKDVQGIAAAISFFFRKKRHKHLSNPEIFFLIERVSNIKSALMPHKIQKNVADLISAKLLSHADRKEVLAIFKAQVSAGRVKEETGTYALLAKLLAPRRGSAAIA